MNETNDDRGGEALNLSIPDAEELTEHRGPADPEAALAAEADAFVASLLNADSERSHQQREAVDTMGADAQQEAVHRSAMLQTPLRQLAHQGDDGGPVARSLEELRGRMEGLDPNRHALTRSGVARLIGRIPGVGSPVQRYFRRFETAQEALDGIIHDLEAGRDMLRRDNLTLSDDQAALRASMDRLERDVALGRLIDERLVAAAAEHDADHPRRAFIEGELLFPLRQRVTDLQQQLAVAQQGVLALEVVIRNNRELMRGVDRAINVTVSALNVAVTVAMALANQRLVLDRVEALNSGTSDMIAGTARALRDQGVDIQNRAASTSLDMEQLEQAFTDVLAAIDDVSRYRREALPRLDEQIDRLDELAKRGRSSIRAMEEGNASNDRPEQ